MQVICDVVGMFDVEVGLYDLILVWDVLDYLDCEQMEEFFVNLELWCLVGICFLVFFFYLKEMFMYLCGFCIELCECLIFELLVF